MIFEKQLGKEREKERKKGYSSPKKIETLEPQWVNKKEIRKERNKGYDDPENKALKPEWLEEGEWKSSKKPTKNMSVDGIFEMMERGTMEEKEGQRMPEQMWFLEK